MQGAQESPEVDDRHVLGRDVLRGEGPAVQGGGGKGPEPRLLPGLAAIASGAVRTVRMIGAVRRRGALVIGLAGLAGAGRQQEAQGQQQCQEFCRMLHRRITFFP